MKTPSFYEHDTTLHVWEDDPSGEPIKTARRTAIRALRERGFRIGIDPKIARQHACIKQGFHRGHNGDLEVKVQLSGRHLEIKFFQNLNFSNPHGGDYDFDKRERMPYLLGKRYEVERRHLIDAIEMLGYRFKPTIKLTGWQFVDQRRAELAAFQGPGFYTQPVPSYNSIGGAKQTVEDLQTVYFRGYDSRWRRGICRRNINNMWWVVLPCGTVRNLASFELFRLEDIAQLRGRQVPLTCAAKKIKSLKEQAAAEERYEAAARLRDVLSATQLKIAA